jgi:arginine decarboxylase
MNIRQIQESRELYGIDGWGAGYFSIDDLGQVVCHPTHEEHLTVPICEVVEEARKQGMFAPMIVRFPQAIESQLERMHGAFKDAIWESRYPGRHRAVFPFKVNQRREFIDHIVAAGLKFDYGLEVGSKTEFIAALSYRMSKDALFICNGFKDREFIELGFIAAKMGKNVLLVVEGPDELQMIIDQSKKETICPEIGIRARLYSRGSGKWEKSSGEASKFGLTTVEVLRCLKMMQEANLTEKLAMLHFHIGSQITEIKRIKNAIKEASRVYAKIVKMGYSPKYLNIGGGIGVDYDGSKTSFESSANYSLQEFANDVVYVIGEVCQNEDVKVPDVVTESGRVIAAYHSVVVADTREVQGLDSHYTDEELGVNGEIDQNKANKALVELKYIVDNMNRKNFVEFYHDATEYHEELFTLFNLGYLNLQDRSIAEEVFHRICRKALYFSSFDRHQLEEFQDLQGLMVGKYLANFSIFQSIPDAWSIDQLFPVMPLSHHDRKPSVKARIVDITCDSDGCLDRFIDRHDVRKELDLHSPDSDEPYYLGFFLVGAYQESLANEHNLFGATNEVEVVINSDGSWDIAKTTAGDPVDELLVSRNYDMDDIKNSYREQLSEAEKEGLCSPGEGPQIFDRLLKYMSSSPYLKR